jgi:hypothetical protein
MGKNNDVSTIPQMKENEMISPSGAALNPIIKYIKTREQDDVNEDCTRTFLYQFCLLKRDQRENINCSKTFYW